MIINGGDRLVGWKAIYAAYDDPPATVAGSTIPEVAGTVEYCSCGVLWPDLPKFGLLATVLTIDKPDGSRIREVWNGAQVYCPYNHPAGSDDEARWMKWGVWVKDYGSFANFMRRERAKKDEFITEDLWQHTS